MLETARVLREILALFAAATSSPTATSTTAAPERTDEQRQQRDEQRQCHQSDNALNIRIVDGVHSDVIKEAIERVLVETVFSTVSGQSR